MAASFNIPHLAVLAPMAGVAGSAFRQICMEQSAALCTSEMISAMALVMQDRKSAQLAVFDEKERPLGIQLFGHEPGIMGRAAAKIEALFHPDFIDINMGCPAPKITSSGAGSALMKDPPLACSIAREVCRNCSLPVSVKIRAGYDEVNAPELAAMLEQEGVCFLTVHGRTRQQMYHGSNSLSVIADVKRAVGIPVIGNGDVQSPDDAVRMITETGCDAVAVGRGCLGNPFLFHQINAVLEGLPRPPAVDIQTRMATFRRQVWLDVSIKGEHLAMLNARKHASWYCKGLRNSAKMRVEANSLSTLEQLDPFICHVLSLADETPS